MNPEPAPGTVAFGQHVERVYVCPGALYPVYRHAAVRAVRREMAHALASHGVTPPADEDMPAAWSRVPFEVWVTGSTLPYREDLVTDDTEIDDRDRLILRVQGVLSVGDDGRTVLSPLPPPSPAVPTTQGDNAT